MKIGHHKSLSSNDVYKVQRRKVQKEFISKFTSIDTIAINIMSSYNITKYSKRRARELNVDIAPSYKENKKIDVIKNGTIIASVGDVRYKDYPTYMISHGKTYANKRRGLYRKRHKNDICIPNMPGYYANKILW